MTKKSSKWYDRVEYAKQYFSPYMKEWRENEDLFTSKIKYHSIEDDSLIYYVNLYKQNQKTFKAQSIPTDVDFHITKKGMSDTNLSAILNAIAKDKLQRPMMKSLTKVSDEAFKTPWGVWMVDFESVKQLSEIPVDDPLEAEFGEEGTEPGMMGVAQIQDKEEIRIFLEFIPSLDFIFDPYCRDMYEDSKWFARKVYIAREDFDADERFSHKDEVVGHFFDTEGTSIKVKKDDGNASPIADDKHRRVELWEIWSVSDRETIYIADGLDKVLYRAEYSIKNPDFLHPFCMLSFIYDESNKNIPPTPMMSDIHSQHDEYNMLRDIEQRDCGRKIRKFIAKAGSLDPEEQVKLETPYEHSIVFVKQTFSDEKERVSDILNVLNENSVPVDVDRMLTRNLDDMRQVIGYGPGDRGGMPESNTATESIHLRQMIESRTKLALAKVLTFLEDTTKKSFMILAEKMTETEEINMTPNRSPKWATISGEILRGRVNVTVMPGTKNITDSVIRSNQLLQTLKLLSEMRNQGMAINVIPIVEEMLQLSSISPRVVDNVLGGQKTIALQAAQLLSQMYSSKEFNPNTAQMIVGLLQQLLPTILTEEEMMSIKNQSQGNAPTQQKADVNQTRSAGSQRSSRPSDSQSGTLGGGGTPAI